MPLHGIGEAVVDVEQHARMDRVLYGFIAGPGRAERREVGGTHVGGREGELLEEAEGRAQLRVERRRAPVRQHGRDQPVVLQGQRRDRAVTLCSEHALVEA